MTLHRILNPGSLFTKPRTLLSAALLALLSLPSFRAGEAEQLTVTLLSGKSGKPKRNLKVYIVFDDPSTGQSLALTTSRKGRVQFEPGNAKTFQVRLVGELPCDGSRAVVDYSVREVVASGMVMRNGCGPIAAAPIRGQVTYFVYSASWMDLFRN